MWMMPLHINQASDCDGMIISCANPEGGWGQGSGLSHLKSHKSIVFLSNTGPNPQKKITKSQHSMLGHHWHASETPFKWYFAGGPIMAH